MEVLLSRASNKLLLRLIECKSPGLKVYKMRIFQTISNILLYNHHFQTLLIERFLLQKNPLNLRNLKRKLTQKKFTSERVSSFTDSGWKVQITQISIVSFFFMIPFLHTMFSDSKLRHQEAKAFSPLQVFRLQIQQ